jgi:hypothetical protein
LQWEKHVNRKIGHLGLACTLVAASQLVTISAAKAEILNLICRRGNERASYWIDTAKGTILVANVGGSRVDTYQVAIAPEAFRFKTSMGHVTIDRITGVASWPYEGPWQCSRDKQPLPARKF